MKQTWRSCHCRTWWAASPPEEPRPTSGWCYWSGPGWFPHLTRSWCGAARGPFCSGVGLPDLRQEGTQAQTLWGSYSQICISNDSQIFIRSLWTLNGTSLSRYPLTFNSSLMRREDAGVSTGGGADVQVELDVFLQSEALSVVTSGEDGSVVVLLVVTRVTNVKSMDKPNQYQSLDSTHFNSPGVWLDVSDVKGAAAYLVNYRKDTGCLAVTHLRKCSSWQYRYLMSDRRATISAWQSLRARPLSLMYSPLMHFVPVETQMTSASFTSAPEQEGTPGTSISHNIQMTWITLTALRTMHPTTPIKNCWRMAWTQQRAKGFHLASNFSTSQSDGVSAEGCRAGPVHGGCTVDQIWLVAWTQELLWALVVDSFLLVWLHYCQLFSF